MSMGGDLGGGGFFGGGMGNFGNYGPRGPYGAWPGCGCSSVIIVLALIFLACGGCLRQFGF